jgi:hypothetical protein
VMVPDCEVAVTPATSITLISPLLVCSFTLAPRGAVNSTSPSGRQDAPRAERCPGLSA